MRKNRKQRKQYWEKAQQRFEKQKRYNYLAEPGPLDYLIVLDNLKPSFNIGKIFRSADAFGANGIHLIGIDFFDPAPAKGSFKWVPTQFHNNFNECYQELHKNNFTVFIMEPEEGVALPQSDLPIKSAFVFGHEEFGFSFDKNQFKDVEALRIPQFGKVQSLNVSIAASVVMYEYARQHASLELLKRIPQQNLTGRD